MEKFLSNSEINKMFFMVIGEGSKLDPRFVIDEDNREVYRNLIFWLCGDRRMKAVNPITKESMPGRLGRGIYLAGKIGTGKTVALRILRRLYPYFRNRHETGYCRWMDIRADDIVVRFALTGDIEDIKRADVLCIQDLGTEPLESVFMGTKINVLQRVLEYRGDHPELITMVTSNYPIYEPHLEERYGPRTVSRMFEMMNYIPLKGTDRRKNF